MRVRLTHLDGKLPNLALMKLADWHRSQGNEVHLARTPSPTMFEPQYDVVYGSTIFTATSDVTQRLRDAFPDAIIGGTGLATDWRTVEDEVGEWEHYDYSIYPQFQYSIGFTQRGCRLKCGFCVVPKKEGSPVGINSIYDIWQKGRPKALILLDNDFFGQEEWRERIEEINGGDFKVNFCQGVNIRMITPESAKALASVKYYNTSFTSRRLYTAWDNIGHEKVFFRGFNLLMEAGVRPSHVMVYMLIGYKPNETMEEIMHRYQALKTVGAKPYPMVYDNDNKLLKRFQRWVVRRYDEVVTWEEFVNPVGV